MPTVETGSLHAPIESSAATDMVLSPDGTLLYVSTGTGDIAVYSLADRSLVRTFHVGEAVGALDVSADGTYIAAVAANPGQFHPGTGSTDAYTTNEVFRIDTSTGQVTSYSVNLPPLTYPIALGDIAIFENGTALISQDGSNRQLIRMNLADGSYSIAPRTFDGLIGILAASADHSEVLYSGEKESGAWIGVFDETRSPAYANEGLNHGLDGYPSGILAFSLAADLAVQQTYSVSPTTGHVFTSIYVYDSQLNYQLDLVSSHPEFADGRISGLAFSSDGSALFVLDDDTDQIVEISTSDWQTVRTFDVGVDIGTFADGAYGNRLLVTSDGQYFLVQTATGIQQVANDGLANTFVGSAAGDILNGGQGDDVLSGRAGNDVLDGGSGSNDLYGGAGDDTYVVASLNDHVFENPNEGTDTILSAIAYSLAGSAVENLILTGSAIDGIGSDSANAITGNSAANRIDGAGGDDTIDGAAGDDVLQGGAGNDRIDGGDGIDTATYADAVSAVIVRLISGVQDTHGSGLDQLTGIENLTGSAFADTLVGNSVSNRLDGGAGADTMSGGKGDDTYWVDNIGDKVLEADGEGSDTVNASVTYSLAGQYAEVLNLTGSAAINGTGNSLNNRIVGNAAANTLVGGDGSDRLDGGAGADTLKGGLGNDVYVIDQAGDKIVENDGEGTDTVEAYFSYSIVGQYIEILKLMGTDNLNATGNGLANTLYGNAGNNVLNGGTGADTMYGGAGNDTYVIDNAGDRVFENANEGTDTAQSSVTFSINGQYVENLTLTGSAAINGTGNSLANVLTGNGAANLLSGGGGDDQLHGGLGSDTLTGGAGADSYWFETTLGAGNVDTLTDFNVADDTITLDRTIFAAITADGAIDPNAFWQGATAHDADDRIVYDKASGKIYYDADGSGAGAAVLFAQVTANTALTSLDFTAVA